MHALIIIRFHFQPISARVGVSFAVKQGSDSLPLVDFYRRCISRRDKCKQGGPGQEGCLKLDCRLADGRRTVLTRHRALFLKKKRKKRRRKKPSISYSPACMIFDCRSGWTEPMQRKALHFHTRAQSGTQSALCRLCAVTIRLN